MMFYAYEIEFTPATRQGLFQFPCCFRALSLPAFWNGTALYKLPLRWPARYSEDIDLVGIIRRRDV